MDEHLFDSADSGDSGGSARGADRVDSGFDDPDLLNRLRCRSTEWLRDRRSWLVREQRRLRVEELAVTAVLDERGPSTTPGRPPTGCRCDRCAPRSRPPGRSSRCRASRPPRTPGVSATRS